MITKEDLEARTSFWSKFTVRILPRPEDVIREFVPEGHTPEFHDDKGAMVSLVEVLEGIKENGVWAFVDPETREIAVWMDPKLTFEALLFVLGHEIGHVVNVETQDCEDMADNYGFAAYEAYRLATLIRRGGKELELKVVDND